MGKSIFERGEKCLSKRQRYTDDELIELAKKHHEYLTSVGKWNEYARKRNLPHSSTFIQRFGGWNILKERLELETNEQHRPQKYSTEELISILSEHKNAYTNIFSWNQYAMKHKLPTHWVFERHLGIEKIQQITGMKLRYTKENLKELIRQQFPEKPPSVNQWNERIKQINLPSAATIIRKFGSWKQMKYYVYYGN